MCCKKAAHRLDRALAVVGDVVELTEIENFLRAERVARVARGDFGGVTRGECALFALDLFDQLLLVTDAFAFIRFILLARVTFGLGV
jgi:hypothetical protein